MEVNFLYDRQIKLWRSYSLISNGVVTGFYAMFEIGSLKKGIDPACE